MFTSWSLIKQREREDRERARLIAERDAMVDNLLRRDGATPMAPRCPVIQIEQLRAARAQQRARGNRRPTGGAA